MRRFALENLRSLLRNTRVLRAGGRYREKERTNKTKSSHHFLCSYVAQQIAPQTQSPAKEPGIRLVVIVVHANGNERNSKTLGRSCAGLNRFNFAISRSSIRHQRIEQLLRGQRHFVD